MSKKPPKTPSLYSSEKVLTQASQTLSAFADAIESQEPTEAVVHAFKAIHLHQREGVDRFILAWRGYEAQLDELKKRRDFYAERTRSFEKAGDAVKIHMANFMRDNQGISYAGDLGKLALQANSAAALVIHLVLEDGTPAVRHKHLADIVDPGVALSVGIADEFLEEVRLTRLNTKAVREFLEGGGKLDWAEIKRGDHLRIRD